MLLISYYPNYKPNPNPNLIKYTKNNSGVKTLTAVPRALGVRGKLNYVSSV